MRIKIVFILFFLFYFSVPAHALRSRSGVSVSASIGENRITLWGFTSPFARVELSSTSAFAVSYSDSAGRFVFDRTILPKLPGELCLVSVDDNNRRTFPVCIPQPPPTNYHTDIGPVILPPTLTIENSRIAPHSTAIASGQGIPSSTVSIYLYQASDKAPLLPWLSQALAKIAPPVYAFGLPALNLKSDLSGNYSFNLPTTLSSNYRLYGTVKFEDQDSPKSNTLTYHLPSLFWLFFEHNAWLFFTLPVFVITLGLFFSLLYMYYRQKPASRYLPAVFSYPLQLVYER